MQQVNYSSYILHSSNTWRKKCEYNEAVHQLLTDFKKAYDSVRMEVLYNILTDTGIPMKPLRLIKMCLYEKYSGVQVGKHLSGMFPTRNGMKQGDVFATVAFQLCFRVYHQKGPGKSRWLEIKWLTSASGL